MFDVAAILINYNSSRYTLNCIESILDKTANTIKLQIIVIDNASKFEDLNALKKGLRLINNPYLELIESEVNTGFGGGNMIGVQSANAKYLAFINNDTLLNNDCISILKDFMMHTPDAGVCGPQAFTENGDILPTIDHFSSLAKTILKRQTLEFINPKKYPNRKKLYGSPIKGQFVAGSFMFFRSEDFNAIGGFDLNIFLYHEETDLCKRLLKLSKFAYLVPKAQFTHFHGGSTERSIAIKKELKISLLYVVKKHYGYFQYAVLLTYLQITYFFKSLFKPTYWPIFNTLIKGAPLSDSLKHQ
ncbi:MAG: glycosyltransferase family 2 protein [Bacteroidia bacterium]|nr:glycosyltransferase family 2 protein [Bacteroidia bacterium]NND11504.1 glycosyltransferase family 2 protein [Flavobacteriaceae bacterium]MBT8310303.1 glycosyltransferase family 2 protein [Bacteroidia bacterium]NNK27992.1 glycosyltransferase family 2 protein [Flavobacteriaceae bacterium]NNL59912.1 glycosyltransferase family 2 protein [Flavobacteriaceae bacterium]